MSSWVASKLSMARRITLIHSILNTFTLYAMQSSVIPKGICDELDRISRNFLWGATNGEHKLHNVSWEVATKSKEHGGFGTQTSKVDQ